MSATFEIITVFIVICVVSLCTANMGDANAEPTFVLNFDSSMHVCADADSEAHVDTSGVEVINYNETLNFLSGNILFHKELSLNIMLVVMVEKRVSDQFEIILNHEMCNMCDELHGDSGYFKYIKFFGLPQECPIPAGEYIINNFVPDCEDLPLNSSNAGTYRVTVMFYVNPSGDCKDEKTFLFCLKLSFVIESME